MRGEEAGKRSGYAVAERERSEKEAISRSGERLTNGRRKGETAYLVACATGGSKVWPSLESFLPRNLERVQ